MNTSDHIRSAASEDLNKSELHLDKEEMIAELQDKLREAATIAIAEGDERLEYAKQYGLYYSHPSIGHGYALGPKYYGAPSDIFLCYIRAGAHEKLKQLGDYCATMRPADSWTAKRAVEDAQRAYVEAGATEQLVLFGDTLVERGYTDDAIKAYVAANAKEKLISLGNQLVKDNYLKLAMDSFFAADAKENLMTLADLCIEKSSYDFARYIYVRLGVTEKLVSLGDMYLSNGNLNTAIDLYVEAGATEKVIEIAELAFKKNDLRLAESAYRRADLQLPSHLLIAKGDDLLKRGHALACDYYRESLKRLLSPKNDE